MGVVDYRKKEFLTNMKHKLAQSYRRELCRRLITLHKATKGSRLVYESGPSHHVWKDLVLYDKKGNKIAYVCTTGSLTLNHWFCGSED